MKEHLFISERLRFRNRVVMAAVAISYLVMIIAVAVSSGFRYEIRNGISRLSGDIQITPPNQSVLNVSAPIEASPSYLSEIEALEGVREVRPVIYRAGIVKVGENIHGVMVKGVKKGGEELSCADSVALPVSIPERLSEITGLRPGDRMLTYFIGEKTKVRQFNVISVYDALVQSDNMLIVYSDMADLQRVDGWKEDQVSSMEVYLDQDFQDDESVEDVTMQVADVVYRYSRDSETPVVAQSSRARFAQMFDWLDLIDFNVMFILALMTLVAGFNMISGMLIMLFENRPAIGVFKALGMRNMSIFRIFLTKASGFLFKSMLAGNLLAFAFCIVQDQTHMLTLDPENYFVSFVPVSMDVSAILIADMVSFVVIMLILLLSAFFISRVDPSETVKMK